MTISEAIRLLKDYVEQNQNIYQRRIEPTLRLLASRMSRGLYERFDSLEDFIPIAELGAREYGREYDVNWKEIFPADVQRQVSQLWKDEFERECPKGTYNFLLTAR